MPIYLGLYAIMAGLGLALDRAAARQAILVFAAFLLLFMGTRYATGCDFGGYFIRFLSISTNYSYWDQVLTTEPGFQLLIVSVRFLGLDYMWLNLFASAIIVWCFASFSRNFANPLLIFALLFPIMGIQLGMSGLRQALAVSFLMLAARPFIEGKRIQTGMLILLAAQFHASAVIFLPMAFLAGRQVSTLRIAAALALLLPISGILLADRFEVYSDRYIAQIYGENAAGGAVIRYFLIAFPVPFFFFARKKMARAFPKLYPMFKLFILISATMAPLVILSSVALHRINYFVMPFSIVILVHLSMVMFRGSLGQIARAVPPLLYGGYSLFWFLMSDHAKSCYLPYNSYLFL